MSNIVLDNGQGIVTKSSNGRKGIPVDARTQVQYYKDIQNIEYAYENLQVIVTDDDPTDSQHPKGIYVVTKLDANNDVDPSGIKSLKETVNVTKQDIGLENVDNVKQIPESQKGIAGGVAELNESGKIPESQLPSYVDDVIEGYLYEGNFYTNSSHTQPITGEVGKIYVDLSANNSYRWSGSQYTQIGSGLQIGTTQGTAFEGSRGAAIEVVIPEGASSSDKLAKQSQVNLKQDTSNIVISFGNPTSNTKYPSEKLVKDNLDLKLDKTGQTPENHIVKFDANGKAVDSGFIIPDTNNSDQILGYDNNESGKLKWINKPLNGQNGDSAYQIWLDNNHHQSTDPGYSETDFLNSLKAHIGKFQYEDTDSDVVSDVTNIGDPVSSINNLIPGDGNNGTDNTLDVIVLMNNGDTTTPKTMMFSTSGDSTNGYRFYYVGDLQSAMSSNVVTTDMIDDEPTVGSNNLVKSGGVEKYLAQDILSVPDPSRTTTTFVSYNGQVETNTAYSVVKGIELAPGEIIYLNQGNSLYTSANGAVLFETDSEGNFISPFNCIVRGIGGWTKVSYKNTGSSTIYVGLCAYDYSTYRQCGYKIWKGNKVAAANEDLQSEIQRATQVENAKLSFTESQSLTPEQKTQALSNLGISGTETTVNPKSDKLPTSSAVYNAISQRSKILTLVGNGETFVNNGAVVDGFIPGHKYKFTLLNVNEWTFPSLSANNDILGVYAFNNKEGVTDVSNNKVNFQVLPYQNYSDYIANPKQLLTEFECWLPTVVNDIPIDSWYVKVYGRASDGVVLKILAEDVTYTSELSKEETLNTSELEWIPFEGGDGYRRDMFFNATNMNIYAYPGVSLKMYYYKAKAGDVIRVRLESVSGVSFTGGIVALSEIPRIGLTFTYLLNTSSLSEVNSSTINIQSDCYVAFCYAANCTVNVKNKGTNWRVKNLEESVADINTEISELASNNKGGITVTDSTAFLDKKLILDENRTYYFDDTFTNETSYEDTSYLDRKIMQVPEGKHFIYLTDSHIDYFNYIGSRQKETEIVKYVRDRLGIKNVMFGGDCIGKQQTKYKAAKVLSIYANEKFEAFGSDFLFVMGNHDTNNFIPDVGTIEDARISDVEVYKRTTKYMKEYGKAVFPTKLVNIIETSNDILDYAGNVLTQSQKEEFKAWAMMNYYYDDDRQKIRYIVLESGDGGNTMNEIFGTPGDSQNSLLTVGYFFIDALNSVPQDYDVVVSVHWIGADGRFWNRVYYKLMALYKNKQSSTVSFIPSHQNVENIVEKTFDNPSTFDIPVDFRDNLGSGRIFSISGHNHYDRAKVGSYVADGTITSYSVFPLTIESTPQQLEYTQWSILCIECDRCCAIERGSGGTPGNTNYLQGAYSYPNDSSRIPVEQGGIQRLGTVKEVLFDVITITPDNRVVCTRFGAEGEDNGSPYVRDYVLPMRVI